MFLKSIRWRIQAWHTVLLLSLVTALLVGFYKYESHARFREVDSQLHALISPLLPKLAPMGPPHRPRGEGGGRPGGPPRGGPPDRGPQDFPEPPPRDSESLEKNDEIFSRVEEIKSYYVAWSAEEEVTSKSGNAPAAVPFPNREEYNGRNPLRTRGEFRELIHHVPNGSTILLGKSTAEIRKQLNRFAIGLAAAGFFVVALGSAGGWWLASRAIRPIQEISTTADKIAEGNLSHRINVSETESELGELAGVLNRTFERLEKAFEQQVRFTGDASHELRTPISVILTQIQLSLSRERSPEDYRKTLETCERAAERMRTLTNQLLELARVDSGEFEVARLRCDLSQVARESLEFIEPLVQQKKVTLQSSLEPIVVNGDSMKLGQVLINLLTNAIQHNPEGIELNLSVKRNGNKAIVRVSDNGAGIPQEALPQIFDRFFRVDQSRSRSKGNSGLGLAISKAIVEAHGGTICAESAVGVGSKFVIELPISEGLFENWSATRRTAFGVPPSGGRARKPPEGGTPNRGFQTGS